MIGHVITLSFLYFRMGELSQSEPDRQFALVIDGSSLALTMQNFKDDLTHLCQQASAVLCCRLSPLQKAEVNKTLFPVIFCS